MKIGAENRKQIMMLAGLGAVALGGMIYNFVDFGSSASAPTPPPAPVTAPATTATSGTAKVVSSANLDPTLHPEAMLLTESFVYAGNGRNIFSANSAPLPTIPKPVASVRPTSVAPVAPMPVGPPPPAPIDLRFFGTSTAKGGARKAFLLRGDDVFIAAEGDIVSRRYQVKTIAATYVEVTDLQNNNTQRLPLAQ